MIIISGFLSTIYVPVQHNILSSPCPKNCPIVNHKVTSHCLGQYSNRNLLKSKQPLALSHLVARRHIHLQLHRHFHLSCRFAHGKLPAQPSYCLSGGVLRTRCNRQRTDEEIRRAVRYRALVSMTRADRIYRKVPRYRCTEDCKMGLDLSESKIETECTQNFGKEMSLKHSLETKNVM